MKKALSISLLALACSLGVYAQAVVGYGAVTGQIRDTVGDGIPDSVVVLTNKAYDINRAMISTDDGVFDATALTPAAGYALKITRKGFVDFEIKDFEIHVGDTLRFNVVLQSTESTKPVPNGPGIAQVEQNQYAVANLVTRQQVDALPNKDRRSDTLALLGPSVSQDPNTGVVVFDALPYTNAFLTDGILTVDTHFLQTPGLAPELGQDALGEMQVVTAAPSAEFVNGATGFVNVATRVQTGRMHGSAYGFFNDHDLNANPRFAPGFQPSGSQIQGGATAGGSAAGNHLFWTSNFEYVDTKAEGINRITNPLIGNAAGTAVALSNCTATAAQCISAANFINSQLNVVVPRSLSSLSGFAKVDYHITDGTNLNIEADALHSHAPNGAVTDEVTSNGGLLGSNGSINQETRFAKASMTSAISGIAVNDLTVGWYRDRFAGYPSTDLFPGTTGALGINIAGTPIGASPLYPERVSHQRRQAGDAVSLTVGAHTIHGGAVYSRTTDWTDQVYDHAGTYNYPSLTAFASDYSGNIALHKNYSSFTQNFGLPVASFLTPQINGFLQDTWTIMPRLSLTVGVYFEKDYVPQPPYANAAFYETGSITGTNKDFAPRVGIAYLLNSRTVLRVGAGSYFQPYVGQLLDGLYNGNAISQGSVFLNPTQTSAGAPVYPKVLTPLSTIPNTKTTSGATNIAYALNIGFRNPYVEQGTVAIERSISRDTTLTGSYVYSRGVRLWSASDQNLPVPTTTETYTIDNASGAAVGAFTTPVWTGRTNTEYAHVWEAANEGESWYNAMVIQFRKRMSHGILLQASYTWSHALDDVSGDPIAQLGFIPSNTYVGDYRPDRGDSRYDQRHRAVINWVWEPRLSKGNAARYVVNGWQLSGIATLGSSFHETPTVLVSGQQFSGVSMAYTTTLDGSGGWGRAPFLPVGSLLTGPQYNADVRLSRQIPISERVKATFMFEAFNAFNHQYATSVNTIAYTATLGVLKPVPYLGAPNAADSYPYGTNARHAQVALRITF